MKTIETKEDLVKWAREINNGISLSRKCDMQDIYAHTGRNALDTFFTELPKDDRRIVLCSISNCMGHDETEHMLVILAKHHAKTVLNEEVKHLNNIERELIRRENRLKDSEESVNRKLRQSRKDIDSLECIMKKHKGVIRDMEQKLKIAGKQAKKFEMVKQLLSER